MAKTCQCPTCESIQFSGFDWDALREPEYYASCMLCGGRCIEKMPFDTLPDEMKWLCKELPLCQECFHGAIWHGQRVFDVCWADSGSDLIRLSLLSYVRHRLWLTARGETIWWHFRVPFGGVDVRDDEMIESELPLRIRLKPRVKNLVTTVSFRPFSS